MLIAMTLTPDVYVRSMVYFPAPLGWALVSVGLADELAGTYIPFTLLLPRDSHHALTGGNTLSGITSPYGR